MTRIIALSLALIAACAAVFVFNTTYRQAQNTVQATVPGETAAVAAAPAPAPDTAKPAPSPAQNEVAAAAAAVMPAPKTESGPAESGPAFDVARVNENGEAVIAGSAPPGATVELLRNGQPHDSVVVDGSGQFVMTPPPLPPGEHELTLRAKAPDGTVMQSKNSVSVAVVAPRPGASPSENVATATKPERIPPPVREAHAATEPASPAASVHRHRRAASVVARAEMDTNPPAAAAASMGLPMKKVVSRGDSLWLISRLAYGDGMRYALIFKANRDRIRDPDRIYPGQTFVLPANAR